MGGFFQGVRARRRSVGDASAGELQYRVQKHLRAGSAIAFGRTFLFVVADPLPAGDENHTGGTRGRDVEGIVAGETSISTVSGGLQYRSYAIEDLATNSSFEETATWSYEENCPPHKN